MRVEELLNLARINIFATSDNHVLDPPDDVEIAVVVHHRQIARVHPAGRVDGFMRGRVVVPVTEHDRVAARAEFARSPSGHQPAGVGVDDLDLDVWVRRSNGGHSLLQRVVGVALGGDR